MQRIPVWDRYDGTGYLFHDLVWRQTFFAHRVCVNVAFYCPGDSDWGSERLCACLGGYTAHEVDRHSAQCTRDPNRHSDPGRFGAGECIKCFCSSGNYRMDEYCQGDQK